MRTRGSDADHENRIVAGRRRRVALGLAEMASEEGRQLRNCGRYELGPVVHVDVGCAIDNVEFLRLLGLFIDLLTPEERVSLGTSDDEQRPGRDRVELLKWEEGYLLRKT